MKNFFFISLVIFICGFLIWFSVKDQNKYKVLKVYKSDTVAVDFNRNSVADQNETVKFIDKNLKKTSETEYFEQKFTEKKVLNKTVKIEILDKNTHPVKAKILTQEGDLAEIVFQNDSNIKKNKTSDNLNLVWVNKKSHKYHSLDCKYVQKNSNFELMPLDLAQKTELPCAYCMKKKNFHPKKLPQKYIPPDESNIPYFNDGVVSLYVTNPNLFPDAPDDLRTAMAKAILENITQAKTSIKFATFGVEGQKQILKILLAAQCSGVDVKWVTDIGPNGKNLYKNTLENMQILKNVVTDFGEDASALMHNKFFIFDSKTVFVGSANLSNTDMSGFNANVFIKINSESVANVFEREFEQMYSGYFHNKKQKISDKTNICLSNKNIVSVYFSPKDNIISTIIVPLINDAKEYVYVPIFFLTDESVANALIAAKNRGVEVRVIIDAVAASNNYSKHKKLREAKIAVKTENWAGKMHQKSLIIDDDTVVIGSMNFSKSGDKKNDESCVVIKNAPALAKKYKQYFLMLYNSIPQKWLVKDPAPESPDSVGSCYDRIDNDYDGKIDSDDEGCFKMSHKKH